MIKTKSNIILKVTIAIVAMAFSLSASAQMLPAKKQGSVVEQLKNANIKNTQEDKINELLNYAFKFMGTRYRSGSSSPAGFDCSGFTKFVFKKFGVTLNASSSSQINNGQRVKRSDLKPGDLVFFNGRAVGSRIGHVGIVTKVDESGDGFSFIHASCDKGITVTKSSEPYYQRRYMGATRVTVD